MRFRNFFSTYPNFHVQGRGQTVKNRFKKAPRAKNYTALSGMTSFIGKTPNLGPEAENMGLCHGKTAFFRHFLRFSKGFYP